MPTVCGNEFFEALNGAFAFAESPTPAVSPEDILLGFNSAARSPKLAANDGSPPFIPDCRITGVVSGLASNEVFTIMLHLPSHLLEMHSTYQSLQVDN
ncbi:hypothetical protein [Edaphobacter bradus]|uniref:hypothetical protein n=1 Tax=Edaphobacter bradus TaxID=2259016 RepID=UPI0021E03D53|nr:hypothetical protein [Edaphobacter bradus]